MFIRIILYSVFTLCLTHVASAQCNVVVAPNGSDANPGTLIAPLLTPNAAAKIVPIGGVICMRAGTYAVMASIVLDKASTIESYPGESASLFVDNTAASPAGEVIFVAASNVTIQNLDISGGSYYGIHVNSYLLGVPPANTRISQVKVHNSGYVGIKVYQGDNVQVLNSEIFSTGTLLSGPGIDILAAIPSASNPSGPGATVTGTYVHDMPSAGIVMKAGTVRGLMEKNRVERISGGGILNGGDSGVDYFRNGATSECIDCTVRNNLVLTTDAVGIACWGAQGAQILNNTVVNAAGTMQAAFFAPPNSLGYTCNNAVVQNNVFVTSGTSRMVHVVNPGAGVLLDHNLYYNAAGNYAMWWESSTLSGYWYSLAAWQSGTGQDQHSVGSKDPMLDAANSYKPLAASPVIDYGTTLPSVADDYLGVARPQGPAYDMGAFEFPQKVALPVPSLIAVVSGSGQSTQVNTAFAAVLVAKVTDSAGAGVAGVTVTFTAPASGAEATFNGTTTASVKTNASGVATSPALKANGTAGSYAVKASAGSLAAASYSLTNNSVTPVAAATVTSISGGTAKSTASTFAIAGTVTSKGAAVNAGTVQFFVNGVAASTVPVSNGRVSWAMPIPSGSKSGTQISVYGAFNGTASYAASRSSNVTVTVK